MNQLFNQQQIKIVFFLQGLPTLMFQNQLQKLFHQVSTIHRKISKLSFWFFFLSKGTNLIPLVPSERVKVWLKQKSKIGQWWVFPQGNFPLWFNVFVWIVIQVLKLLKLCQSEREVGGKVVWSELTTFRSRPTINQSNPKKQLKSILETFFIFIWRTSYLSS